MCESVCVCVCVWGGGGEQQDKRGQKQGAGRSEGGAAITNIALHVIADRTRNEFQSDVYTKTCAP